MKAEHRKVPISVLEWGLRNNLKVVRTFLYLKFQGSHIHRRDHSIHSSSLGISERTFYRHITILQKEGWLNYHNQVIYLRPFKGIHKIIGSPFKSRLRIDHALLSKDFFNSWFFSAVVERMVRYYESNREIDDISRVFTRPDKSTCRGIDISVRYLADSFQTSIGKIHRLKSKAISQGAIARVKNALYVTPEEARRIRARGGLIKKDAESHYVPQPDTLVKVEAFANHIKKFSQNPEFTIIQPFTHLPVEDGTMNITLKQPVRRDFEERLKRKRGSFSKVNREKLRLQAKETILEWFDSKKDLKNACEIALGEIYSQKGLENLRDSIRDDDDWHKYLTVKEGCPWATLNFGGRWVFKIDGKGQYEIWIRPFNKVFFEALRTLDYSAYERKMHWITKMGWLEEMINHYPSMDISPISDEERLSIWSDALGRPVIKVDVDHPLISEASRHPRVTRLGFPSTPPKGGTLNSR